MFPIADSGFRSLHFLASLFWIAFECHMVFICSVYGSSIDRVRHLFA